MKLHHSYGPNLLSLQLVRLGKVALHEQKCGSNIRYGVLK